MRTTIDTINTTVLIQNIINIIWTWACKRIELCESGKSETDFKFILNNIFDRLNHGANKTKTNSSKFTFKKNYLNLMLNAYC